MSTRTNITIKNGSTTLHLYRHHDGYPAETGADLVEALRSNKSCDGFVKALLNHESARFEITSCLHGDIQHAYLIDFGGWDAKETKVGHATHGGDYGAEVDSWAHRPTTNGLEALVALVNRERQQMNVRIAQLRSTEPRWADAKDYPMI